MKAVILAAGQGSRLIKYTHNLPKGMLPFRGKPLLEWHIQILREKGIHDISIVKGYESDKIQFPNIRYYHNLKYASTNMIESLMCMGRDLLEEDTLIIYSDVLFSEKLLEEVLLEKADIVVAADKDWQKYWIKRYGTTEFDLESLTVSSDRNILELGKPLKSSENLSCRYIGLNKFSQAALEKGVALYQRKLKTNAIWQPSGKPFYQGYFTDFINELIQEKVEAKVMLSKGQWLEFDTEQDYEMVCALDKLNKLDEFITL